MVDLMRVLRSHPDLSNKPATGVVSRRVKDRRPTLTKDREKSQEQFADVGLEVDGRS